HSVSIREVVSRAKIKPGFIKVDILPLNGSYSIGCSAGYKNLDTPSTIKFTSCEVTAHCSNNSVNTGRETCSAYRKIRINGRRTCAKPDKSIGVHTKGRITCIV